MINDMDTYVVLRRLALESYEVHEISFDQDPGKYEKPRKVSSACMVRLPSILCVNNQVGVSGLDDYIY